MRRRMIYLHFICVHLIFICGKTEFEFLCVLCASAVKISTPNSPKTDARTYFFSFSHC